MIKFGTGGWRALIGEEFTKSNVKLLSQAVANIYTAAEREKGIVIGFDRRFLSDKAALWMAEVFAGNGIKVNFIDRIAPTPLVMYAVQQLGTGYGAAVTASHNPAAYNGIKVFTVGGRDADELVTASIERKLKDLTDEDVKSVSFEAGLEKGIIEIINPFNDYIDSIIKMIDMEAIRKTNLKVLLDPMYGVSKTSLQTVLISARCEIDTINDRHDTLFGGRLPSPNTATLRRLSDMVVEKGYDLGIGTDGDADRLGIIDEKGDFIHPNDILVLLYFYLLKYKGWMGGVVRNLATTHLLDKIAAAFGEEAYEVPVGFKYISSKMEEKNALIGGESSGGLTIRGHIKGKDGIFAASLLVELISVTGKRLSELLEDIHQTYGSYFMLEEDFKFNTEKKSSLIKVLFEDKRLPEFGYGIREVSYRDGCKVYFENGGWIVSRFSGTEPLLRIFTEMGSKEEAASVSRRMKDFLGL